MKMDILLNTIEKVKDFVNTIMLFDGDADITSGHYVIDAKSIMGIFSLDLSSPLTLDLSPAPTPEMQEKLEVYKAQ